ncbi:MAG: hypothetical protein NC452_03945 [Eubacterium sp.]|nr:hypothetical protein [Eubacterium sp.]
MALSVTLYETEIGVLLSLPEEQRGRILTAILCDTVGNVLPEMDVSDKAIFTLVNAQVKRAAELSSKRKQSAKTRWQSQANTDSNDALEEQDEATAIQNNANGMQIDTSVEICTDLHNANRCTITNTNTNTKTNTNTNTNTETETNTHMETAPVCKTDNKPKKSKKPLPEKHKFAEFVSMTNDEYSSLVAKLGEQGAKRCIEILDNYKGQSGKNYKNDYRAILNWVTDRYSEEQAKQKQPTAQSKPQGTGSSGNPFLDMLRDLDEQEAKEIVVQGNIADNGDT